MTNPNLITFKESSKDFVSSWLYTNWNGSFMLAIDLFFYWNSQ